MSEDENGNATFPKGRNQTDKSLSAERAKTDESLSKGRIKSERQADDAVLLDRAKADEARKRARLDADQLSKSGRANPGVSRMEERRDSDRVLLQERQHSDDALNSARQLMDSVLERERSQKRAVALALFQAERKETDKDLKDERSQTDVEVQRAAAALTTRDEFLSIVSHDLRNPMGAISMATDLLMAKPFFAEADEETREYVNLIGRNANEALRLISDLMDMEGIAVGKLGLQIDRHDVCNIVQQTLGTFKPLASIKGVSLQLGGSCTEAFTLCDSDRVSQVLSNLVSNAIKFTSSGGVITLSVQILAREIQVSVVDTGLGIQESMHKTIFERFWQIGKHDRRGLGLGLYISKMIVETGPSENWCLG